MNKKGFTLIELVSVISLLGVIGIMISLNFTNNLKKQNNESSGFLAKKIETAAEAYASTDRESFNYFDENNNTYYDISVGELKKSGFLHEDIDSSTTIDDQNIIRIFFIDGLIEAKYIGK